MVQSISFVKPILSDSDYARLDLEPGRLPAQFYSRCKGMVRDGIATPSDGDRNESNVRLVMVKDRAYFKDGWRQFLTQNGVSLGSVIQFKFRPPLRFKYRIFRAEDNDAMYVGVGNAGPFGIVQCLDNAIDDVGDSEDEESGVLTAILVSTSDDDEVVANAGTDIGKKNGAGGSGES